MEGSVGSLNIAAKYVKEIQTADPAVDKELRQIAERLRHIAETLAARRKKSAAVV